MSPPLVGRLLESDPALQPVVAKALEISALTRLCTGFLPPGIARSVRAAHLKDGQLVILAGTSAGAAKLKLLAEGLRGFLLEQGTKVKAVSVRVQPEAARAPAPARRRTELSAQALAALAQLHRRLPDSPARSALKTLLDHHLGARAGSAPNARRKR